MHRSSVIASVTDPSSYFNASYSGNPRLHTVKPRALPGEEDDLDPEFEAERALHFLVEAGEYLSLSGS